MLNRHCPVTDRPHEFSFKSIILHNIQFNLTQKCSNMCRLHKKPNRSHTCIVILSCKERLITTILFYSRLNCLRDAYRCFTIKCTPVLSYAEGARWREPQLSEAVEGEKEENLMKVGGSVLAQVTAPPRGLRDSVTSFLW